MFSVCTLKVEFEFDRNVKRKSDTRPSLETRDRPADRFIKPKTSWQQLGLYFKSITWQLKSMRWSHNTAWPQRRLIKLAFV